MLIRILGVWATVAGISLLFSFFWQYRARTRYLYLFFYGAAALLWGVNLLAKFPVFPLWLRWLLFGCGIVTMLMDSTRRYRETSQRLRQERIDRLAQGRRDGDGRED